MHSIHFAFAFHEKLGLILTNSIPIINNPHWLHLNWFGDECKIYKTFPLILFYAQAQPGRLSNYKKKSAHLYVMPPPLCSLSCNFRQFWVLSLSINKKHPQSASSSLEATCWAESPSWSITQVAATKKFERNRVGSDKDLYLPRTPSPLCSQIWEQCSEVQHDY